MATDKENQKTKKIDMEKGVAEKGVGMIGEGGRGEREEIKVVRMYL